MPNTRDTKWIREIQQILRVTYSKFRNLMDLQGIKHNALYTSTKKGFDGSWTSHALKTQFYKSNEAPRSY